MASAAPASPSPSPMDFLPARRPPLLYLGFAHACLATAFVAIAFDPRGLGGFYYHPKLVAVVHLATLGWITGAILGSIYVVGPLALRLALKERASDLAAFACFAVGVSGMASHFWIDRLSGMAWSAGLVLIALVHVAARAVSGLLRAPVPAEARLPVTLAFLNVLAAAAFGVLLGVHKGRPVLPMAQFDGVLAHAHLAVLGFGVLMVMGAGYRLLPMVLPAAMPRGAGPYAATALTQGGAWGLFAGFLTGGRAVPAFAVLAAAGIGVFLSQVVWMARHRRPAPAERPRPDWSVALAVQALAYLGIAAALGVFLAFATPSRATVRASMVYGVLGLAGFFGPIVAGMAGRLLPLYGWLWGFADRGHASSPPSLHRTPSRALQLAAFAGWTLGIPALAMGMALERHRAASAGAALLAGAVVCGGANLLVSVWRLWRRTP